MLASIAGASGTLEERDSQIERSGLYGEYPAIVSAYIELFSDPESTLEALKRALFLVWRSATVSPTECGVAPLPDGTVRAIIDELESRARRDAVDAELGWMLGHYHALGPTVLELYRASDQLVTLAESASDDDWRRAKIDAGALRRRGQMGRYWSALAADAQ